MSLKRPPWLSTTADIDKQTFLLSDTTRYTIKVMVAPIRTAGYHKKRHGKHQQRSKQFMRVYSPYLPLILFIVLGIFIGSGLRHSANSQTLGYTSDARVEKLLEETNKQRSENGLPALRLDTNLDQAAQRKASDMVSRNYWSHTTPDGQQPWTFIKNSDYTYAKAGENLAYGFPSSDATVLGWMNSETHRENMLSKEYVDVGFGFADSSNFVSKGPETVVVAFYATPNTPASSNTAVLGSSTTWPAEKKIVKLQTIASGVSPWAPTLLIIVMLGGLLVLAFKHTKALAKGMKRTERYVLKHPLLDIAVILLVGLCFVLSRTSGIIR